MKTKHDKLFDATVEPLDTPEALVDRLSVEGTARLPFLEERFRKQITAFRRLRHDARVRAARRYLAGVVTGSR